MIDVWDALTHDRVYRPRWREDKARQYIRENAGVLFDPRVVEAFFQDDWVNYPLPASPIFRFWKMGEGQEGGPLDRGGSGTGMSGSRADSQTRPCHCPWGRGESHPESCRSVQPEYPLRMLRPKAGQIKSFLSEIKNSQYNILVEYISICINVEQSQLIH